MASDDKKTVVSSDPFKADPNPTSAGLADRKFLHALQDFIVPLIQVADRRENNINHVPLGPEAKKLITALQEFISSVVKNSQSAPPNTIEVSLAEDEKEVQINLDDDEDDNGNNDDQDDSSSERGSPPETPSEPQVVDAITDNLLGGDDIKLKIPPPTFHEKLLSALREHVFNKMPIRLLCFQSNGSSLQISLRERGAIYTSLESVFQERLQEVDQSPIQTSSGTMETEEEATTRLISKYARYAILSHTWLRTASGEVTYSDWDNGLFDTNSPGYQKLINFCKTAWNHHGLSFGWMDTVCINKESSAELDESIRSMYNWYNRANVCVIYLSDTATISTMHLDRWFTRGWTLQELLAPDVIKFYTSDWKKLVKHSENGKVHVKITKQIERATTITDNELSDIYDLPLSRRMQLAANRVVTREEDIAYSLMGIFEVSISTAYGEGVDRAFFRLLQEILNSNTDQVLDLFNWAGDLPDSRPFVLPPSPQSYLYRSSNSDLLLMEPMEPLTFTHMGLHMPIILMPAISISDKSIQYDTIGDFNATVHILPARDYDDLQTTYNVLDKRLSGPDGRNEDTKLYQITLAVFNFDGNERNVFIPRICMAKVLECAEPAGKVTALGVFFTIETKIPIAFNLSKLTTPNDPNEDTTDNDGDSDEDDNHYIPDWNKDAYYRVKKNELTNHGMQLVSLYM